MLTSLQVYFLDTRTPDGKKQARILATFDDAPGVNAVAVVEELEEQKGESPSDYEHARRRFSFKTGQSDSNGLHLIQVEVTPLSVVTQTDSG